MTTMKDLDVDDKRFRMRPYQQMMASCCGALVTATTMTPFDVVKIRMQSQQKAMLSNKCFVYCNGLMDHVCQCVNGKVNSWVKRPGQFSSMVDAFGKIAKSEGMLSLWSGLPPTLIMAVPATIIYFVSFEQLRLLFADKWRERTGEVEYPLWLPLIAGGLARTWSVTVVSPLELIRTKMQSKQLSYTELYKACRILYTTQGLRGYWMGWGPSVMRDVPFSAIYWGGYESIKRAFNHHGSSGNGVNFVAGALAGSVAATITLPFDVVKTHRQIEMGEADFGEKSKKQSTTTETIRRIYKGQGIGGLFTGIVPRIVKVAPACAIMISSYEYAKTYFARKNMEVYCREKSC